MPRRVIEKIRDAIRNENYDMTSHAYEEMAEDNLTIPDVENAILNGRITKKQKDDPRGTTFVVQGNSIVKATSVGVAGRFKETGVFLIITVYEINKQGE